VILVDTSVLIDLFSGRENRPTLLLRRLIQDSEPFYLAPPIIREVLQGARNEADWRRLRSYLTSQMMVDVTDGLASEVAAARIYFECRRRGLTVRSAADCLIAQIALESDLALLHNDRDFEAIRKVRPLKTLP
jgi:predicted nucleic acid-binding protein